MVSLEYQFYFAREDTDDMYMDARYWSVEYKRNIDQLNIGQLRISELSILTEQMQIICGEQE